MQTDTKDMRILNELSRNAKIPLRKLASVLGTSFVTVRNRIGRLERNGVIVGYSASIDFEKLGFDTHVIIDLRISKGKLIELERKIANSPNVYAVYDTTGEFDATVLARFQNTRSMDNFLKRIQTLEFVERTNTRLVLNTIKEGHITLR